jgi:hypothetical protein
VVAGAVAGFIPALRDDARRSRAEQACHQKIGDGELPGCVGETDAEVTLHVEILKGKTIPPGSSPKTG